MSERVGKLKIAAQSPFSLAMFALSAATLGFTSLQGGNNFFGMLVALFLMVTGIVGAEKFKVSSEAPPQDSAEQVANIGLVSAVALSLFMVFSYLVPTIVFNQSTQTATYNSFYGQFSIPLSQPSAIVPGNIQVPPWLPSFLFLVVLIPNAEEQYFRGFWGNLAISKLGDSASSLAYVVGGVLGTGSAVLIATLLAAVPGGLLFGLAHTPAYAGSLPIILTLSADGTMIIALNSLVGRLDVGILAHMGNNALSFAVQQSSILSIIPNIPATPFHMAIPLLMPGIFVGLAFYRRRRRR